MEPVPAEGKILLHAARDGKLGRFKRSAAALSRVLGDGIQSVVQSIKDQDGRSAIHFAAFGGSLQVLKYLIEELQLDVDIKCNSGKTTLSHAALTGRLAAVEYLLQMGANPEILDDSHCSPLHHAAKNGHKDIIPLLLSKGMDVDVSNGNGSPLEHAAIAGIHDTVKVLLDHGANPNVVLYSTFTPLYSSIFAKSWQCVEALLKAGADPNGGPDGIVALNIAVRKGVIQIIKLLVEAGADPNVANIHGLKPIEFAAVTDNRQGVEILFPVTSPIPSYVDWSIEGIINYANSKEFHNMMMCKVKAVFLEAKSRGTDAVHRKEYWLALHWYTEALGIIPDVYVDKGELAFQDATQCMLKRPDWPEAFYRAGEALKLLNAAEAFSDGLKVDPKNKELKDAFREVSSGRLKAINAHRHRVVWTLDEHTQKHR